MYSIDRNEEGDLSNDVQNFTTLFRVSGYIIRAVLLISVGPLSSSPS